MEIKPLYNQILIEPVEVSGVLKDPNNPSFALYGKVTKTGPDCKQVKEGDIIAYLVWGLNHTEIDGKKYYFVSEQQEFLLSIIADYEPSTLSPVTL
jgi:co-chaperonin GroES (HSP10)